VVKYPNTVQYIEERGSEDKSLRNNGKYFKRPRKNTVNTDLGLPVG
jgi:hypothetical protein